MRKHLFAAACICLILCIFNAQAESIPLDASHFPDSSFRLYLSDTFDTNHDGALSGEECSIVLTLNVPNRQIASLEGIEWFPALESLSCWGNRLTELDLSRNPRISDVYCGNNRLESLNVRGCALLQDLSCYNNYLARLDVSGNPALVYLTCGGNRLKSIDVSGNPKLMMLEAEGNICALDAPGGELKLSALPDFDASRASDWQGCTVSDGILTMSASGDATYVYDCGRGFHCTMTLRLNVTPVPSPQPEEEIVYALKNAQYDGALVTGVLSHDAGKEAEESLQVRVTFFITGNYYMATVAEVEANGSFEVEGIGPIEYITLLAYETARDGSQINHCSAELFIAQE